MAHWTTMAQFNTFLVLTGTVLTFFTYVQGETNTKRSAENPLSSLGGNDGWKNQLNGLTANFPVKGADSFGMGNFPGMGQGNGAAASQEKSKRSADNPLSSLGGTDGWQNHLNGLTANFPVKGADSFGMGNFPGMGQGNGAAASPEKSKRSADNPLSSLGGKDGWQNQLNGLTANFPVKGADSFGMGNFPGMGQGNGAAASPEKSKRSADNPLSSLGGKDGWQNHLNGLTANFPVKGADSFGMGNFPGMGQGNGAAASPEKSKRSADNPLSSLGGKDGWQNQLNGLTANFPVKGADSFGMGNFPGMGQGNGAAASPEKSKRSADNPLSSLGGKDGWQNQLNGLTANFPVKGADSFGMGNFPGMGQGNGAAASPEKSKRSADNPLSSLGGKDGWQNQLNGLTANFPVKGADSFGMGNFPGMGQGNGAAASPEKSKRSADNPLSSLGGKDGWQNQLNGLTANFPVKGADSFGMGNFPGMGQGNGAAASPEKSKRSADNSLSSLGGKDGWQNQLNGLTANFPVKGADSFGMGNFPGMGQGNGAAASPEKSKRSADNPLSSLGGKDGWQNQLNGLTANFPVKGADSFGMGNFPGMGQGNGAAVSQEKSKRSADNPLSSLGGKDGWQNQLNGLTANFPVKGADSFGMGNFPGMGQGNGAAASPEKSKRSADNPLSSLGGKDGWQNQLNGLTANFPVKGADSFGMGNFPGMGQGNGAAASPEKSKRSADNPLSSLGGKDGWQNQLNGLTANFPVKGADSFGMGNFPGMGQGNGAAASAEKKKRSSQESSLSWTEKLKSLFSGNESK